MYIYNVAQPSLLSNPRILLPPAKKPHICLLCVCTLNSHSVMSDFLSPFGLLLARLLCLWDSPGKNTGVGCHARLQGIFPTQGWNLCLLRLLHGSLILYLLGHRGRQWLRISPPLTPWQPLIRFLFLWFCLRMTLQREFPTVATTSPLVRGRWQVHRRQDGGLFLSFGRVRGSSVHLEMAEVSAYRSSCLRTVGGATQVCPASFSGPHPQNWLPGQAAPLFPWKARSRAGDETPEPRHSRCPNMKMSSTSFCFQKWLHESHSLLSVKGRHATFQAERQNVNKSCLPRVGGGEHSYRKRACLLEQGRRPLALQPRDLSSACICILVILSREKLFPEDVVPTEFSTAKARSTLFSSQSRWSKEGSQPCVSVIWMISPFDGRFLSERLALTSTWFSPGNNFPAFIKEGWMSLHCGIWRLTMKSV